MGNCCISETVNTVVDGIGEIDGLCHSGANRAFAAAVLDGDGVITKNLTDKAVGDSDLLNLGKRNGLCF